MARRFSPARSRARGKRRCMGEALGQGMEGATGGSAIGWDLALMFCATCPVMPIGQRFDHMRVYGGRGCLTAPRRAIRRCGQKITATRAAMCPRRRVAVRYRRAELVCSRASYEDLRLHEPPSADVGSSHTMNSVWRTARAHADALTLAAANHGDTWRRQQGRAPRGAAVPPRDARSLGCPWPVRKP